RPRRIEEARTLAACALEEPCRRVAFGFRKHRALWSSPSSPGPWQRRAAGGRKSFKILRSPRRPPVLQSPGSVIVGGDIVFSDALGSGGSGHIAVNQMYVQYKVPPCTRRRLMAAWAGRNISCARGTQSISPTRSRGRDRDSTRLSSAACMQESRCL